MGEVDVQIANLKNKNSKMFIQWMPDNIKTSYCNVAPNKSTQSQAILLGCNDAIKDMFSKVGNKFTNMFRRKAFLHWYTGEGMDEMEFTEAESNLYDLISEHQSFNGCFGCCHDDEEMEEE